MLNAKVAVIGGGIAGMEVAYQLSTLGTTVDLIEKTTLLGGHLLQWHKVFPDFSDAEKIIENQKLKIKNHVNVHFGAEIYEVQQKDSLFIIKLTDEEVIKANAIVLATGFTLFPALKKEEYGYTIYDNVITSADLEGMFKTSQVITTKQGKIPQCIAFVHCVGSRDEKIGNRYCSKVCCITAVKQAIELAKLIPGVEIYSFYMDLRMFDRQFEDIFYQAQSTYKVKFIRGRVSEIAENSDYTLLVKAEDTLLGRPLRLSADMVVLMVGMNASNGFMDIGKILQVERSNDRFFNTVDFHLQKNISSKKGIFLAGTCTGPKTIAETIADARSAAFEVLSYLQTVKI